MKRFTLQILGALILALGAAVAAPAVIGTVTATGSFRLNGDTVMANGTLTEGAVIENGLGSLSVRLAGGARLSLSAGSRGKLYSDRILLSKGEALLQRGFGFDVEALGLSIRPESATSTGRIDLMGTKQVRVAALTGSFRVVNALGVLVANVAAGSALAFEPQTPTLAAATHITGTLTQRSGHFLLTDQVTHVTVEVTGQGLQAQVGQIVQVIGTLNTSATPVAGASQVIAATSVQTVGTAAGGAAAGSTGGAAAAGAGGASAGAGIGIGVTAIAIVGGVAAAATLGGLAASGALPGQSSESR